jgi:hypothetical protein
MVKCKVGQKITFNNRTGRRVRGTVIAITDTKLVIDHGVKDIVLPIDDDSIKKGWPGW